MTERSPQTDARPVLHDPDDASDTLAFVCGADMNPAVIDGREGFSTSRFVAIASADAGVASEAGLPEALASGEIWGIVLRIPTAGTAPQGIRREPVSITMHDGERVDAVLMTNSTTAGTADAILQQAQYWELPGEYVDRLKKAATT